LFDPREGNEKKKKRKKGESPRTEKEEKVPVGMERTALAMDVTHQKKKAMSSKGGKKKGKASSETGGIGVRKGKTSSVQPGGTWGGGSAKERMSVASRGGKGWEITHWKNRRVRHGHTREPEKPRSGKAPICEVGRSTGKGGGRGWGSKKKKGSLR